MEIITESRTRVFALAAASLGLTAGIFALGLLMPSRVSPFALAMLIGTRAIAPNLVTVGHGT